MKILRPVLVAAVLWAFAAGAAFADDIHVVFDPTTTTAPLNGFTNIITSLTPAVGFTWTDCSKNPDISGTFPLAPDLSGDTACAEFANDTGVPITQITFNFAAGTGIPGADSVSCDALDQDLSLASCGQNGDVFSITFAGGTAIPATQLGPPVLQSLFFIGETGVALTDINNLSWTASVPEPSSLTMLAAGIGLLGLGMVFLKR